MREKEWLTCRDPLPMFEHVRRSAPDRCVRLFACAACRGVWRLLTDERSRRAVEVAEQFADGLVSPEERERANRAATDAVSRADQTPRERAAAWGAAWVCTTTSNLCVTTVEGNWKVVYDHPECADLLRDIFGNPFRPPAPRTFPAHVAGLAEACHAAFPAVSEQFLILADALADLGEDAAAAHCRESVHARGCHVVDWVLGKRGGDVT